MSVVVVRYRTEARPGRREPGPGGAGVRRARRRRSRDGLRYATFRLADGDQFVHVAEVTTADGTNPLAAIAAFAEFQREIPERMVEGPVVADATLVGSYGFGIVAPRCAA